MKIMATLLANPLLYDLGGKLARYVLRITPDRILNNNWLNSWAKARELPKPPKTSFKTWYIQSSKKK